MLDLSALDAELDGLGRVPEDVTSLARGFAGMALSGPTSTVLAQVDAELSALSNGTYQAPPAPAQRAPSEALPSGVMRVEPAQRAVERAPEAVEEAWHQSESDAPPAFEPESARSEESALHGDSEDTLVGDSLPPAQHEESGSFAQIPAATRGGSLTESQEIVLPDPIAREELSSESGELSLSGNDPSSGSFELPDSPTEPRIVTEDVDARAVVHNPDTSREPLMPFDDVQDALEGSQPIAVSSRSTIGPSADLDRDPDAEFDALLSEATDPRGIPTGSASGEVDTDDLLRGLEGEFDDEVTETPDDDGPHEADMLTRSLYEDSSDNTDILDRETLGALEAAAAKSGDTRPDDDEDDEINASLASLMGPDELDSGELEIIDDEPTLAPQPFPPSASMATPTKPAPPKAPTARPSLSNKAPPPPPPSSGDSKRPSFLGRLFTKREGE